MNPKAQPIAEDLAREMKRPDPLPTQHLFGILTSLRELEDMREEAAALGETAEEKAAQDAIAQYVSAKVVEKKVDGICAHIREWRTRNDALLAEASRLIELAKRYASRADSLEAATLNAMRAHGVKQITTDRNTLKTRQAGGVGALEVDDVALLPDELVKATVTLQRPEWNAIEFWLRSIPRAQKIADVLRGELERRVPACDNTAIREALKRGEKIPGVRIKERAMRLVME